MAGRVKYSTAHSPRGGNPVEPRTCDVAIVGAGAAGLATAIFVGREQERAARLKARAPRVLLIEGARRPGAKILVSGGSRCNVANAHASERDFWGGRAAIVRRILHAFPAERTVEFFREIGVPLHEEAGGKLFPDSNRSRDVLDALLRQAARVGIVLLGGHRVLNVACGPDVFQVATASGEIAARRVVLATGGRSLPKSGSDGAGLEIARTLGHRLVDTTPALAPLRLAEDEPLHRSLSGVSQDVELAVWVDGAIAARLRGPMLWTHFGVSGPAALDASRHWARARIERREAAVTVSFEAGRSFDEVDADWADAAAREPRLSVQTRLGRVLPASAADALLTALALDGRVALAHFPRADRRRLVHALTAYPLRVADTRGYTYAEATAGGVALDEIDPATMESRVCPRLHLVGEMLDVDGRLGGFNFQWAWSSGYVAGTALGRLLTAAEPRT